MTTYAIYVESDEGLLEFLGTREGGSPEAAAGAFARDAGQTPGVDETAYVMIPQAKITRVVVKFEQTVNVKVASDRQPRRRRRAEVTAPEPVEA